jgi:hypothetical protein
MAEYAKRDAVLSSIIDKAIQQSRGGYRSYLMTKKFGYRLISKYFIGENVLEMGSDESPTTSILARWSEKLTVVDMADKFSKKILKDKKLATVRFIRSRWEEYTPDERYSDIVLTDGLEHTEDPVEILSIAKNWLSKDGRMHIIVPNALSVHRLLGAEMGYLDTPYSLNQNDMESGHIRVYDIDLLKSDIKKAGLSILTMQGVQLKPLTDGHLTKFPVEYIEALNRISHLFNNYCAEIYVCCIR